MSLGLGASAVILDKEGRVLLAHRRDQNLWNLPGGGAFPGESPCNCAVRETEEETTLIVGVERLIGVYNGPFKNIITYVFLCEKKSGELQPTKESDRFGYFKFSRIPSNTLCYNSVKEIEWIIKNGALKIADLAFHGEFPDALELVEEVKASP